MAGAKLGANEIGRLAHGITYVDENGNAIFTTDPSINKATQLLLHAGLGATSNILTGNDALSGAVSGVIGEITGDILRNNGVSKETGVEMAGLTAGLSALITGKVTGLDNQDISDNVFGGYRLGKVASENNAYMADRPLEGFFGYLYFRNSIDDYFNTEFLHEQIFWEDIPGDNTGFFADGLVRADKSENISKYIRKDDTYYDDALLRQAVDNVKPKPYNLLWVPGNECKYNCQDWMQDVRDEYNRLLKQRKLNNP